MHAWVRACLWWCVRARTTTPHPWVPPVQVACRAAAQQRLHEWSAQLDAPNSPSSPEAEQLDAGAVVRPGAQPHELVAALAAAAAAQQQPTGASSSASRRRLPDADVHSLLSALPSGSQQLAALGAPAAVSLLASLARLRATVPQPWLNATCACCLGDTAALAGCSTRQLAEAAWAVCEVAGETGPGTGPHDWADTLLAHCVDSDRQVVAGCGAALHHTPYGRHRMAYVVWIVWGSYGAHTEGKSP
jgi:hypothetical protein